MIILRRPLGGARIASWFIDDLLVPGALLGLFKIQLIFGSWGGRTLQALTKGKKVYITNGMAPQDGFEPPTQ
jgi:hypothetical protein